MPCVESYSSISWVCIATIWDRTNSHNMAKNNNYVLLGLQQKPLNGTPCLFSPFQMHLKYTIRDIFQKHKFVHIGDFFKDHECKEHSRF